LCFLDPRKVLKTGPGHGPAADPLPLLERELAQHREAVVPGLVLPPLTGGAIGYVGYDCVRYFEPKTARPMKDILQVPEAFFMLFDTIVAFDHFFQQVQVITYLPVPQSTKDMDILLSTYQSSCLVLRKIVDILTAPEIPLPEQPPVLPDQEYTSNIGQDGYESHVRILKTHIASGDIIQAVPSQRFSRPTSLRPFNIYRHLRTVNPSPYLFYVDCEAFQLVGASPELLVKADKGRIITHPIAGTVVRGKTPSEDEALADELRSSIKDRAEHVMLVDLARNDVNRVCDPFSTRVDRLMVVEKFSHVQHLVSQVSGILRPDKTRFDAFRSIFPAGTVSGAPKVRAMELIAELEKEKRGIYAGAVGYFGYGNVDGDGKEGEGAMDTCIALRTMLVKNGTAYLQAGGGIVFDSDPYDEWKETMNKLGANMQCIAGAEERYATAKEKVESSADGGSVEG
jgi:anthranilate synthase component I